MEVAIILFIVVLFISCGSLVLSILTFSKKDSFGDDKSCGYYCSTDCQLGTKGYCKCGMFKTSETPHTTHGGLRGKCSGSIFGNNDWNIKCSKSDTLQNIGKWGYYCSPPEK